MYANIESNQQITLEQSSEFFKVEAYIAALDFGL